MDDRVEGRQGQSLGGVAVGNHRRIQRLVGRHQATEQTLAWIPIADSKLCESDEESGNSVEGAVAVADRTYSRPK